MKTLIFTLALAASLTAHGQLIISSFTGADPLSVGPGAAAFSFTVTAPQSPVWALGVFDSTGGQGLFLSHEVGLWRMSDQALVAHATVPAGTLGTFLNGAWYVNLTAPISLPVGQSFALGAYYPDNSFDFAFGNAASVTMAPGISYGHALLSSSSAFTFPDITVVGADAGFFGANLAFAPVPEARAAALASALFLLAFAAVRRLLLAA